MPDDKVSREQELSDLNEAEKMAALRDEAIAEEDFVAVEEDKVNPMLFDEEEAPEEPVEPTEEEKLLSGAIGSGNLEVVIPEQPFNNEEALRKENVNEDNKSTTPTTETDGAFVDPFASVESTIDTPATAAEPVVEDAPVEEPVATEPAVEETAPVTAEPVAEAAPAEPVAEATPAEPAAEAAPAEPAVEPAVAPVPAADPISATVPTDPATEQAAAAAEPKKKKKTGLIIGIIVALLLIGCGVGFFIWYMIHESPENSVKDAVSSLWNAENISAKGTATTSTKSDSDTVNADITFDVKANNSGVSLSGELKSKVPSLGDISLGGNLVAGNDGVAYVKLNNVKDLLSGLMSGAISDYDDEEEKVALTPEQEFQINLQKAMFEGMGEALSDTWFKIDTNEDSDTKCMLDKAKTLNTKDFRKKVSDAYEKNPFIVVDEKAEVENRDGLKYITVKVDEKAQEEFANALKEMNEVKELQKCSESKDVIDSEIEFEGDSEDEDEDENSLKDAKIKLGITSWSHELKKIEISMKDEKESSDTTVKIDMSYDKVTIEMPSDAKDIKDISKTMKEKMVSKMTAVVEDYCDKAYKDAATNKQCVDMFSSMFDNMGDVDLDDVFSGLAGGLTSAKGGSVINDYL